jgi:hypothetical protein
MVLMAGAVKELLAALLSSRPQAGPLYPINVFIVAVFRYYYYFYYYWLLAQYFAHTRIEL